MSENEDESIKLLRKRYASGKITKSKYESMLKDLKMEEQQQSAEKPKTFYWTYFIGALIVGYIVGNIIGDIVLAFSAYFSSSGLLLILFCFLAVYTLIAVWMLDGALVNKKMKEKSFAMGLLGWILALPAEWILSRKGSTNINFIVAYVLCTMVAIIEAVVIALLFA